MSFCRIATTLGDLSRSGWPLLLLSKAVVFLHKVSKPCLCLAPQCSSRRPGGLLPLLHCSKHGAGGMLRPCLCSLHVAAPSMFHREKRARLEREPGPEGEPRPRLLSSLKRRRRDCGGRFTRLYRLLAGARIQAKPSHRQSLHGVALSWGGSSQRAAPKRPICRPWDRNLGQMQILPQATATL